MTTAVHALSGGACRRHICAKRCLGLTFLKVKDYTNKRKDKGGKLDFLCTLSFFVYFYKYLGVLKNFMKVGGKPKDLDLVYRNKTMEAPDPFDRT